MIFDFDPTRGMIDLVVSKKRSTLHVSGSRATAPVGLAASPGGHSDGERGNEEDRHDDEREDPLEGDNLVEELADTDGGCEDAEGEADGVVLGRFSTWPK